MLVSETNDDTAVLKVHDTTTQFKGNKVDSRFLDAKCKKRWMFMPG